MHDGLSRAADQIRVGTGTPVSETSDSAHKILVSHASGCAKQMIRFGFCRAFPVARFQVGVRMDHVVREAGWCSIDIDATNGRVFLQHCWWQYNWLPGTSVTAWTQAERRSFHTRAGRFRQSNVDWNARAINLRSARQVSGNWQSFEISRYSASADF
jgi:hypothetical protein